MKALLYSAHALTDGFIPESQPRRLIKADSRGLKQALDHLTAVQPGCTNPAWETRAGGWYLHDYDDPQYANPLRVDRAVTARQRQLSGKAGGLASAKARREKYGSAQPSRTEHALISNSQPEANTEAPFRTASEANASTVDKSPPKQTSNPNPKLPTSPDPSYPLHTSPTSEIDKASIATSGARATPADAVINGQPDDPVTELAVGMHALLGHQLSGEDLIACQAAVNQYAYMDPTAFIRRAREHVDHCLRQDPPLPTPRRVAGFSETWRLQNDWLADHGAPKASRPTARTRSMSSLRDTLADVVPTKDAAP